MDEKKKRYQLVIPHRMWVGLKLIADRDGVSVKAVIVRGINMVFEKERVNGFHIQDRANHGEN